MRKYISIVESHELLPIDVDIADKIKAHEYCNFGLKVSKNQRFWRGESEHTGHGMASWGLGRYVTSNRALAKKYAGDDGVVMEVARHELCIDPIRFNSEWEYQIWEQDTIFKTLGFTDKRVFWEKYGSLDNLFRSIDPSIDGVQVGTGKDTLICVYDV